MKSKKYRLGWAAGYTLENVRGDNVFYVEEESEPKPNFYHRSIRIFESACVAEICARQGQTGSFATAVTSGQKPARWFWRAMAYHSHIPRHAKGLSLWTPEDDVIHWMSDEEGRPYVEVPPDPARLVEALSRIRPVQPEG